MGEILQTDERFLQDYTNEFIKDNNGCVTVTFEFSGIRHSVQMTLDAMRHLKSTNDISFAEQLVNPFNVVARKYNELNKPAVSHDDFAANIFDTYKYTSKVYEKTVLVWARKAIEGELIITELKESGVETVNNAKADQMVIKNPSGEIYLLDNDRFLRNYMLTEIPSTNAAWTRYKSIGKIRAFQITDEILDRDLDIQSHETTFEPYFGGCMKLQVGDWVAAEYIHNDKCSEDALKFYRIAEEAFGKTYKIKQNDETYIVETLNVIDDKSMLVDTVATDNYINAIGHIMSDDITEVSVRGTDRMFKTDGRQNSRIGVKYNTYVIKTIRTL